LAGACSGFGAGADACFGVIAHRALASTCPARAKILGLIAHARVFRAAEASVWSFFVFRAVTSNNI